MEECIHYIMLGMIDSIVDYNRYKGTCPVRSGVVECSECKTIWNFALDPATQYTTLYRMWQG